MKGRPLSRSHCAAALVQVIHVDDAANNNLEGFTQERRCSQREPLHAILWASFSGFKLVNIPIYLWPALSCRLQSRFSLLVSTPQITVSSTLLFLTERSNAASYRSRHTYVHWVRSWQWPAFSISCLLLAVRSLSGASWGPFSKAASAVFLSSWKMLQ